MESKEQYHVEISDRFASLENLDDEVDVNRACETIREDINISAKESEEFICHMLVPSEHKCSSSKNMGHRTQNVDLLKNHYNGIIKFQYLMETISLNKTL
jgi:hypothetical protein